ncbi:hypothetical protein [Limosilactobacillus mucosae]|uniref:hypothetical protein n=1 Tax=Limosilactobacillus mucosae TaxID=97478 RepID=UPI003990F97B
MAVITENKLKKYQEGTMFDLVHSYQSTDDDSHLVVTPKATAQHQSTPQATANPNINTGSNAGYGSPNIGLQQNDFNAPNSVPQQNSFNAPNDTPQQNGFNAPNSVPQQNSFNTPNDTPQQNDFNAPNSVPQQNSFNTPNDTPQQNNFNAPNSVPQQNSFNTPNGTPQQNSFNVSNNAPQQNSPKANQGWIRKNAPVVQQPTNNFSDVYDEINNSIAATAEIEKTITVLNNQQSVNFSTLPMQQINLFDIANQESGSYIPLNQDLFNSLETVIVEKSEALIWFFKDGAVSKMAPKAWVVDEHARQLLVTNDYAYAYENLSTNDLKAILRSLSSAIITHDGYDQFVIKS